MKPLFQKHCVDCHGPEKQKAGLRLDTAKSAIQGGDSGAAITPGDAAKSLLFERITAADEDERMPPKGDPLPPEAIDSISAWIQAGAQGPPDESPDDAPRTRSSHWAFQPLLRPALPPARANPGSLSERDPESNVAGAETAIDRFVRARLRRDSIEPAPEADPSTLIRRLSLDLTGLPPAPDALDAYRNDTAPGAYERLVDRLLASPHFGEHWGRHWLDLARYADSDGYEKDRVRPNAWVYRDWVIDAFNDDMPFDEFTRQQLAGDLLPRGGLAAKVATGFHRNTLTNTEGGVDQEEFRCKANVDRTSTTSTIWLGLTVGCAECHTHKFDPITQREFYQLYAFFDAVQEKDIPAPPPDEWARYQAALADWTSARREIEFARDAYFESDLSDARTAWEARVAATASTWHQAVPVAAHAANGTTLTPLPDGTVEAGGPSPNTEIYTVEFEVPPWEIAAIRLEPVPAVGDTAGPGRTGHGNFVLSEFSAVLIQDAAESPLPIRSARSDYSQAKYPAENSIDGDRSTGWAIGGAILDPHAIVFSLEHPARVGEAGRSSGARLRLVIDQSHGTMHTIDRIRVAFSNTPLTETPNPVPVDVIQISAIPVDERTEEQRLRVDEYYRGHVDPTALDFKDQLARHDKRKPSAPTRKARTLAENPNPPLTRIHLRGDFLRKGEPVEPGTLSVLHPFHPRQDSTRPNRLDLADWLMAPENSLTPRVTVNRLWAQLFGAGLVKTVDDFGTRGDLPSHPELLDWLASEYRRLGWSRKALIKTIVMSATYRQTSKHRTDLVDLDPTNRLLARQNRFRLSAEGVRDAWLTASGLLDATIGGPSIRPPLPADIAALGYANSVQWNTSPGGDAYRRGLYIHFQRTVPYPMLVTFDAPDRNATCARRERSNTPLQALTLLNGPVFQEAARALAHRIHDAESASGEEKLRIAFRLCFSRDPDRDEMTVLKTLIERQQPIFETDAARRSLVTGITRDDETLESKSTTATVELAQWVTIARTLLNLDEFITRE